MVDHSIIDESSGASAGVGGSRGSVLLPRGTQVLLLDVGGVIAPDASPAQSVVVEQRLSLPAGTLYPLLYGGEPWKALSTGRLDEATFWRDVAAAAGLDAADLREAMTPLWGWHQLDEAVLALMRIARRRVRVAILTNATLDWETFLHESGIRNLADPIINSAREGLRKPDPASFGHALELLDLPPEAVLFVDDKPRNTAVARELGIDSLDYTTVEALAEALRARGILPPR